MLRRSKLLKVPQTPQKKPTLFILIHYRRDAPDPSGASFNKQLFMGELLAKVTYSVIPAKAGIQNCSKILDSGSRFACPE
jgi:hypothetical protein